MGPKPSASYISTYSSIEGEYFKTEDISSASWLTATLLFWEDFYNYLVDVAMIYANYENDEGNLSISLQHWKDTQLTELRGFDPAPVSKDQAEAPLLFSDGGLY